MVRVSGSFKTGFEALKINDESEVNANPQEKASPKTSNTKELAQSLLPIDLSQIKKLTQKGLKQFNKLKDNPEFQKQVKKARQERLDQAQRKKQTKEIIEMAEANGLLGKPDNLLLGIGMIFGLACGLDSETNLPTNEELNKIQTAYKNGEYEKVIGICKNLETNGYQLDANSYEAWVISLFEVQKKSSEYSENLINELIRVAIKAQAEQQTTLKLFQHWIDTERNKAEHLSQGNLISYDKLLQIYKAAEQKHGLNESMYLAWGRLQVSSGNADKAEKIYERASQKLQCTSPLYEAWMAVLWEQDKYHAIINTLSNEAKQNRELLNEELYSYWGRALIKQGDREGLKLILSQVTPKARLNKAFFQELIEYYVQNNEGEKAIQYAQMAHEQNKANPEIYTQWMNQEFQRKQYQEVIQIGKYAANADAINESLIQIWASGLFQIINTPNFLSELRILESLTEKHQIKEPLIKLYAQIETAGAADLSLYENWLRVLVESRKFTEAHELFARTQRINLKSAELYYWRSTAFVLEENYQDCLNFSIEAKEQNLVNARFYGNIAICHNQLKQYTMTEQVFQEAQSQGKLNRYLYDQYSKALLKLEKYQEAVEVCEQAVNQEKYQDDIFYTWIEAAEKIHGIKPQDLMSLVLYKRNEKKQEIRLSLSETQSIDDIFKRAEGKVQNVERLYDKWVEMLYNQNQYDKINKIAKKAESKGKASERLYGFWALANVAKGNTEEAIAICDTADQNKKTGNFVKLARLIVLVSSDKAWSYREAIELCLDDQNNNHNIFEHCLMAFEKIGRYQEALQLWNEMAAMGEITPKANGIHLTLLIKLKKFDEAIKVYETTESKRRQGTDGLGNWKAYIFQNASFIEIQNFVVKLEKRKRSIFSADFFSDWAVSYYNQSEYDNGIKSCQLAKELGFIDARLYTIWGLTLFMQKKYLETIELVTNFEKNNPQPMMDAILYATLGLALNEEKKYAEAIKIFKKAKRKQKLNTYLYAAWGSSLMGQNKPSEAVKLYQEAKEKKMTSAEIYNLWGASLGMQEKYPEAIRIYLEAKNHNMLNTELYSNWGVAWAEQGKLADAIKIFEEAKKHGMSNAELYNNWGLTLIELGDFSETDKLFEQAKRKNMLNAEVYQHWVLATGMRNNYSKAAELFQEAKRKGMIGPFLYPNWGWFLIMQNKFNEANEVFEEAKRKGLISSMLYSNWSANLLAQDKLSEAIQLCEEARKKNMIHPYLYSNWGLALLKQNKPLDAIKVFEEAAKMKMIDAGVYANWGLVLITQSRFTEAIRKFQEAKRKDMIDPTIYENWGVALVMQAKPNANAAIKVFEEAKYRGMVSARLYSNWGMTLVSQKKTAEAVKLFKEAKNNGMVSSLLYQHWVLALGELGQNQKALKIFKWAENSNMLSPILYELWAANLNILSKYQGTVQVCQKARAQGMANKNLYLNWAEALEKLGKTKEADAIRKEAKLLK